MQPRSAVPEADSARRRHCLVASLLFVLFAAFASLARGEERAPAEDPIERPVGEPPDAPQKTATRKPPERRSAPLPKDTLGRTRKAGLPPHLPAHRKSDTGKVANTSALHGEAKIADAVASAAADERAAPVPPPPSAEPTPAEANQPPPFQAPPADGSEAIVAPQAIAPTLPPTPVKTTSASENGPTTVTLDATVFDQIRQEIKSRLPYFQACADAARRRGGPDVRRVQATWSIAADGTIKEMKVEGVPDPLLATCITRMGGRPFPMAPGTELTIPTPIVFVR